MKPIHDRRIVPVQLIHSQTQRPHLRVKQRRPSSDGPAWGAIWSPGSSSRFAYPTCRWWGRSSAVGC